MRANLKLTKQEYDTVDNYLEYLRQHNCRERATVTLIQDKLERQDKLEQLEQEANAINILIQLINSI